MSGAALAAAAVGGAAGAALFVRRALRVDAELRNDLTAEEWAFALKQRVSDVLVALAFAVHSTGWNAGYIRLAGSAEKMALHYGMCSSVMAVLNFVGEPALSDVQIERSIRVLELDESH